MRAVEDKRRPISLISITHTQDAIGQLVDVETKVDVIANLRSVSLTEWTDAGQLGLSAQWQATIWSGEYGGQEIVEISGKRYRIYRTYDTGRRIELYLEEAVGHAPSND